MKKYRVSWIDYCGNQNAKEFKTIEGALNKLFAVYGWFKNGICIEIASGRNVLHD